MHGRHHTLLFFSQGKRASTQVDTATSDELVDAEEDDGLQQAGTIFHVFTRILLFSHVSARKAYIGNETPCPKKFHRQCAISVRVL